MSRFPWCKTRGRKLRTRHRACQSARAASIGGIILGLAVALWASGSWADGPRKTAIALERAVAHILRTQRADGLWPYDFDFVTSAPTGRDNVTRQAGAAYALGEYAIHSRDPHVISALRASLRRLSDLSVAGPAGALVSATGKPEGSYAGATALALLAELFYFEASGDSAFEDMREAWRLGLRSLWRENEGGFWRSAARQRGSAYADGEAWLALARFEALFPGRLGAELRTVESTVMRLYGEKPTIAFFHWGAMAAAVRHAATGDARYAGFAIRQVRHFLTVLRPKRGSANSCYSLEGLLAIHALLVDDDREAPLREQVERRIRADLAHNLALQIRPGQRRLRLGRGASLTSPALAEHIGAFLAGRTRPVTRIDYTQHCVSALTKMERAGGF